MYCTKHFICQVSNASRQWEHIANKMRIPYEVPGALMIARNEHELQILEKYKTNAIENGIEGVFLLSRKSFLS